MTANELRTKFLEFFKEKGHSVIPSASLVPENDPTALFISAGMQPLVPFLVGEKHPMGSRLADAQKCIRTDDIDEVGDKVHHTFFEMLGNWSLGDYFKKEAIEFSFEFLTDSRWLGLDKSRLAVSVFAGDEDASFDQESYDKWIQLGIAPERIAKLPKKNNWWGPVGETGPCGPDTEMFVWTGEGEAPANFQETHEDPNWVEVWNDVFMGYDRFNTCKFTPEAEKILEESQNKEETEQRLMSDPTSYVYKYEVLKQRNVDTGMGLERMLAVMNGTDDNYRTDLFWPIIEKIEEVSGKKYEGNEKAFRIIADHIKAAVFAIGDGISPSNKGAGYVVRRLIRRAIVKGHQLGIYDVIKNNKYSINGNVIACSEFTGYLADQVYRIYGEIYGIGHGRIDNELEEEEKKFKITLDRGLSKIQIISKMWIGFVDDLEKRKATAGDIFDLYQSDGFPIELSLEELKRLDTEVTEEQIRQVKKMVEIKVAEHQELSRTASAGMFKGGLADAGEIATKYHTATHLLHAALRKVLGEHVQQKGSNINAERLRFDFSHTEKMTPEQIQEVEDIVNEQISKDLPVFLDETTVEEAKNSGAFGFFESKYGEKVKAYTIGNSREEFFSKEICGGPHVEHIGVLGKFKIKKEEASSAGIRRIKAVLE